MTLEKLQTEDRSDRPPFEGMTSRDDKQWPSRAAGEVIVGKHTTYIRLTRGGDHKVSLPERVLNGLKERIPHG